MEQCILLTHVFIREGEKDKLESVEFAMKHWRQHNPDAFIIVTGHGVKPNIESYCNEMIWFPNIIEKEIGKGHPHLVTKGLDIAERKGFEHIVKSRCDTIHNKKDIFSFAKSLLQADKKLLVTQQTSLKKQELGDLFLYGSIELMKKIFNVNNWYPTKSGLNSLANNLLAQCDEGLEGGPRPSPWDPRGHFGAWEGRPGVALFPGAPRPVRVKRFDRRPTETFEFFSAQNSAKFLSKFMRIC